MTEIFHGFDGYFGIFDGYFRQDFVTLIAEMDADGDVTRNAV